MDVKGFVHKVGDNIDTDLIIAARYLNTQDAAELASYLMEDYNPEFKKSIAPGDIIVAGENFGCGSSREHAPIAIKGRGVSCVIAETFARIFYRNSINIGLPILECPEASREIQDGDKVEIDLDKGIITDVTLGKSWQAAPFPESIQKIINSGGLLNSIRKDME